MLTYLWHLLLLFIEFFKTGLFAVGGGLATVPFIRDMGATYGWITETELAKGTRARRDERYLNRLL